MEKSGGGGRITGKERSLLVSILKDTSCKDNKRMQL